MELRPEVQLKTVIKALKDNIIPAVDPAHKVAIEQASLALHSLEVIAKNLPLQYRYDRHELNQYLNLADKLVSEIDGGEETVKAIDKLNSLIDNGKNTIARARAEPSELEQRIIDIKEKVSDVVSATLNDGSESSKNTIIKEVFLSSKEQLTRERSWLAPMGVDPQLSTLASIEDLLDKVT